jgi:hypothetical protein
MSGNQGPGIFGILGMLIGDLFKLGAQSLSETQALGREAGIARKALAQERASLKQHQKWLEEVRRAKERGQAGLADEAEAVAALNGKGGRPSKLDKRKF